LGFDKAMSDQADLLNELNAELPADTDRLLPLVYDELRRLASIKIAQEGKGNSLQSTALVHEAYLRLTGSKKELAWDNEGHFFAAAAEAMRRILVDRARKKASLKRGGDWRRLDVDEVAAPSQRSPENILAIDEALSRLKVHDEKCYQLVTLRYFVGLSHCEAAAALGISRRVADRLWAISKVWLHEQLRTGEA
jgi:RNA polymerase sigma factor (TIGR02999 family)